MFLWSSESGGYWGLWGILISFTLTSSPTLDSRQYGQVALGVSGGSLYYHSLLHYPSPKLDSRLLRTRMIRTQRLYNTRSLHTTLGPLPGYDNLAQLGGVNAPL